MGIQRSPEPGENDADYLYEWGLHGLGIDKFNSLDAPGERYQRSYLMRSVPDVTVMSVSYTHLTLPTNREV